MPTLSFPKSTPVELVGDDLRALRETLETIWEDMRATEQGAREKGTLLPNEESPLLGLIRDSVDVAFSRLDELELTLLPILRPIASPPSKDVAGDLHLAGPLDKSTHGPGRRASTARRNKP